MVISAKCHLLVTTEKSVSISIDGNNETNKKEQKLLDIKFDSSLSFERHITSKKASQKLDAVVRIVNYMDFPKRKVLMKTVIASQFSYCPIIWMLHSSTINNRINNIHERALKITSFHLTLSALGYFCLILPRWKGGHDHIVSYLFPCVKPGSKMLLTWNLAQSYFVMLKINGRKDFQNCSYRDHGVTNYYHFFKKLCEKWLKYVFLSNINLVTARKKVFKIFFQLLKVKITYKFWKFD